MHRARAVGRSRARARAFARARGASERRRELAYSRDIDRAIHPRGTHWSPGQVFRRVSAGMLNSVIGRQRAALCYTVPCRRRLSTRTQTVVAVGLGNMGAPLAGRIAAKFPTSVFDMDAAAAERHATQFGTIALTDAEQLREAVSKAEVVVTCLPNTDATLATVDAVRPSLKAGVYVALLTRPLKSSCKTDKQSWQTGTVWIDATSGKSVDAAALAENLWGKHSVRYLDCAVSGGPKGATNGILAALVGGDRATFEGVEPIIGTFSDKITHLGPAGSGHLVKAVNNALLAANLLTASEGLAALARHGVELPSALQAINGSSGRSWCGYSRDLADVLRARAHPGCSLLTQSLFCARRVTMQRFPDNILTGNAYGFALGMHCKDMDNAMAVICAPHADGTTIDTPMLDLVRRLMNSAREEMGGEVDHTDTTKLAARQHRIDFENL